MNLIEWAEARAAENQRIVERFRPRHVPCAGFLYVFTSLHGGVLAHSDILYLN